MANCWVWKIDPVLLDIYGPLKIRWYGVMFLCTFVFGFIAFRWQWKRAGRDPEIAVDFIYWGFFGVLLGSWFGHRLFYEWDRVLRDPFYLIDVSKGLAGLASHGATIGIILAIILFARRYKLPVGEVFDRFTWTIPIGAIFVRSGNFFNSEIIGTKSTVPWAVCLPLADNNQLIPRHPSQLYEVLNGVVLLLILYLVDRAAGKEKRPIWLLTGTLFVGYFALRFNVEFYKAHQTTLHGSLTMGHYLSIPFFLAGCVMIYWSLRHGRPTDEIVRETMAAAEAEAKRASQSKPSKPSKAKKRRKH
ncbi:MAG: prolipoprotein diacylglyceryl transferase [Myxococcales bacterium]|nr:prolipoprotein diacylglyceryl transferase [Myxococcales bacterium]